MRKPSTVVLENGLALSHVEQGPRHGNAVVMLPGPTDSHRSYKPILGSLPADLRTVAVSLRGHGQSDKPPTGYSIENLAADVVPLLDALEIERAVLTGHSGSCLIARRVAIDAPHRVAGLLLEASPTALTNDANLLHFVDSVVSKLSDPVDADALVTREMQDDLQRLLPRVELPLYGGAGHTPRWEQPERFARDVTAFAARAFP